MEFLGEINDKSLGIQSPEIYEYKVIKSARVILFNDENKIALMYVAKDKYHKLPGGSFERNEDLETALKREVLEETGFGVQEVEKEVGLILEFRQDKDWETLYINYCSIAKASNNQYNQQLTNFEKDHGFELEWVTLDDAIDLISNKKPNDYNGKFIVFRDTLFLKKAKEILI